MIRAALRQLLTAEGRRAWALGFLAGGGMVMTAYAAVAMWLIRTRADFVLYLGLMAHVSILVVMTGFAGLLVKRNISAKVLGGEFSANDQVDGPVVEAAKRVEAAAVAETEAIVEESKT